VIAVVSAKQAVDLETLLSEARDPALLVALDGVEDPRNLGAILRTVEAAGADGVILPERHSAGLSETVSRASAGALEHVRVARTVNLAQAVERLKERGLWVVGFDATAQERWHGVDLRRPVALVLGGEGRGIRRLVRERCDQIVALPLFGHVGSLNVSVAAGIALYEVVRQRGSVPSHARPIPLGAAAARRQIEGPRADDPEEDPGWLGPKPTQVEGDSDEPLDAPDRQQHRVSVIDLHEELGWSEPPPPGPRLPRDWRLIDSQGHRGPKGSRQPVASGPGRGRRRKRPPASPPSRLEALASPAPPDEGPPAENVAPGGPQGRGRGRWRRRRRPR
jgi:23S rRNA (guanosine2251-2'-O)-methyltransferase